LRYKKQASTEALSRISPAVDYVQGILLGFFMAIISHVPVTYPYHASGRVRSQPMAQWILLKEKGEFIET